MAESFSPFLQSHSTMVWLSSRPTEARRLPSAVEGRPKPLSTAQAEPALVQRSLALVSNMKAVWWVWSTAGDSLTPTYRSQQCLCLGPIKGSERYSSTLMLSDCRVWETAEIGLLVLLVNWASCELAPFLMSKRSFFCSPVKAGCLEEFANTKSRMCWISMDRRTKCSRRKQDCDLPEKSRAHTPSWWKPLNTDMGFNVSVSQMWMEESLPTCIHKNIQSMHTMYLIQPIYTSLTWQRISLISEEP